MTSDPQIRYDVIAEIIAREDAGDLRAIDLAVQLHGPLTDAEWLFLADLGERDLHDMLSSPGPRKPAADHQAFAELVDTAYPARSLDGLPSAAETRAMLRLQQAWPWTGRQHAVAAWILPRWSPEQRRLLEERYGDMLPDGAHWET